MLCADLPDLLNTNWPELAGSAFATSHLLSNCAAQLKPPEPQAALTCYTAC
jgi:hypothetical protein